VTKSRGFLRGRYDPVAHLGTILDNLNDGVDQVGQHFLEATLWYLAVSMWFWYHDILGAPIFSLFAKKEAIK
jgi:hypothetical protein